MTPMRGRTRATLWSVVLDSRDANVLSKFYLSMLGWEIRSDEPGWVTIRPEAGAARL